MAHMYKSSMKQYYVLEKRKKEDDFKKKVAKIIWCAVHFGLPEILTPILSSGNPSLWYSHSCLEIIRYKIH